MDEQKYELGLIGLGTMGQNLLMNMADSHFAVAGYDKDIEKVKALSKAAQTYDIFAAESLPKFIAVLKKPRIVLLLVPAGKIVDYVIADIILQLEAGDIIIDGGNSHFSDTNRRINQLKDTGIHFVGMGISGGASGARRGPSMMPGGHPETWERIKPIFEATAAKYDNQPCVAYMGKHSAGHYVKMVHNGIEYGLMQILAEAYDVMKSMLGMTNSEIGQTFRQWNKGRLQSFLVEITGEIFFQKDDLTASDLIDQILDASRSKGTGKWTSQDAMNLQAPVPVIDTAVVMRDISGQIDLRQQASDLYPKTLNSTDLRDDKEKLLQDLEDTVYFTFIQTYAQGLAQLTKASTEYDYQLELPVIASIWRAGCIIRAALLEDIKQAYEANPLLPNLLLAPPIVKKVTPLLKPTRNLVTLAIQHQLPIMGIVNALTYFDAISCARLSANLIQAQRDYFGSHTYERLDRPGKFHTDWE